MTGALVSNERALKCGKVSIDLLWLKCLSLLVTGALVSNERALKCGKFTIDLLRLISLMTGALMSKELDQKIT